MAVGVCDADLVEESLTVGDTEMVLEAEAAGVPEADLVEVSLMLGVLLGVGLFDTEMVSDRVLVGVLLGVREAVRVLVWVTVLV